MTRWNMMRSLFPALILSIIVGCGDKSGSVEPRDLTPEELERFQQQEKSVEDQERAYHEKLKQKRTKSAE